MMLYLVVRHEDGQCPLPVVAFTHHDEAKEYCERQEALYGTDDDAPYWDIDELELSLATRVQEAVATHG